MFDFLLDLIFPRICVGCGRWGKYLCDFCRQKIDYFIDQVCPYCEKPSLYGLTHPRCQTPWGLNGMFVLAHYRGPIREAVRTVKYGRGFAVCQELAELIGKNYHFKFDFDYLVPVPLAPEREAERGFNQAEKLATTLEPYVATRGRVLQHPSKSEVASLLKRVRETQPQFDLEYEERKVNVKGAFGISGEWGNISLRGKSLCLVDDVSTTGATIFECVKVLKRAGAKKVWAICAARGG